MKAVQKGFTLIELMIVVAIIGILAASACRTSITETVQSATAMPTVGGQWGCESRIAGVHPITKYVQMIETNEMGDIRVMVSGTFAVPTINPDLAGKYVILQPSSAPTSYTAPAVGSAIASWTCGPQAGQSPDISKYLPGSCRTAVAAQGTYAESAS